MYYENIVYLRCFKGIVLREALRFIHQKERFFLHWLDHSFGLVYLQQALDPCLELQ